MSNEIIRSDVLYVPKINCCLSCRTMPILGEIRESKIKLATLREVGTKLDVMADKVTGIKDREEKLEALLREIVCIGYWLEAKIKEAEK